MVSLPWQPDRSRARSRSSRAPSIIRVRRHVRQKGRGAYPNNERLRMAARRDMADSLIGCVSRISARPGNMRASQPFAAGHRGAGDLRRLGAAALDLCLSPRDCYDGFEVTNFAAWVSRRWNHHREGSQRLRDRLGGRRRDADHGVGFRQQ